MFSEDIDRMIILVVSSLAAMLSFMAVALPLLNRTEKKERFKNVIEKKRKALFEQAKENMSRRVIEPDKALSARESLVFFYKVQQLFGKLGEDARDQMLQAGIRDPKAPFKYLIARGVIPVVLILFTWLVMAKGDREFEHSTIVISVACMGLAGFFCRAFCSRTTSSNASRKSI